MPLSGSTPLKLEFVSPVFGGVPGSRLGPRAGGYQKPFYEGGLHVYNVYGYPSTDKQAPEKNRELLVEIMGSVASLGCHSPVTHGEDTPDNGTKIDWFLVSKSLLPATGLEEALDYKPDHNAVRLPVELKKVAQGFRGQPDYEDTAETDGITNRYLEAKAKHSGAWTYALVARDVETLWPMWSRAAVLKPTSSNGSLTQSPPNPSSWVAAHALHEPTAEYLRWEIVAKAVRNFWFMVGPKLRERPEAWPRVHLPVPADEAVVVSPLAGPGEPQPQAPRIEGPHRRVVTFTTFARCLDCHRQTGKVRGKFNFPYLRAKRAGPSRSTLH
eukprot:4301513-Amphidinium_carterae.1